MWKSVLITASAPIFEAIRVIDRTGLKIALVVNEKEQLLGTVTDGDIRRAILGGLTLDQPVSRIMNTEPFFVYQDQSQDSLLWVMKNRKIHQVPVLDEEHHVVGLEIADNLLNPPQRENWVIIMAGGLGRRLWPLTESCPKPLLTVGGKPVLETILENFIEQGFQNFYFSVSYKAEMIVAHFGDGSRWGAQIKYLHEDRPLGTAGALGLLPARPASPLLLVNGDILTKTDFGRLLDFHDENGTLATICVKEYHHQIPYGVVSVYRHRLQRIDEKPRQLFFINAGLYVLNPEILGYVVPGSRLDITELFATLLEEGKEIAVFPLREYWIDIGRLNDYEKAIDEYQEVFG